MLITNTKAQLNQETFNTYSGVPQGGVLSPFLFNMFINDLLLTLKQIGCQTRAFADDIVVYGESIQALNKVISTLDEWTSNNRMKINKRKSGLLILKADKRTPERLPERYHDFPVVQRYKYLGIEIDNDLTLRVHSKEMQENEKKLKNLLSLSWANPLPGKLRFEAWQQLVISRFTYAKHIAANYSHKIKEQLKGFFYRTIKQLLHVNANIETDKLLNKALGMPFEHY